VDFTVRHRDKDTGYLVVVGSVDDYPFWDVWAYVDDKAEPPSVVELRLRRLSRASVLTHLSMRNTPQRRKATPGTPIEPPTLTADILRSVRVGDITNAVNYHLHREGRLGRLPDPAKARARDDHYYATWAAHYVRVVAGGSRSPVGDLAAEHGLNREQVRDLIHRCREKGMLPKGQPGVAGGQLTEKARSALGRTTKKGK